MKTVVYSCFLLLASLIMRAQPAMDTTAAVSGSKEDKEDSVKIQVTRLKINSSRSDFSPYLLNDQLVFVSGRNKDVGVQYVDANNDPEITDLYICSMKNPSAFKNVNGFSDAINTRYHEGPFCFNKAGTVIYYTANDKHSPHLKIYRSEKINGVWSKPQPMPFCKADISYCHPALSPDGSYMIFSAGIEKEKKGMDLYLSRFADSSWTEPTMLGNAINDSANQVFPFISAANILYFSSDKKGGMGGLDLYSIALDSDSARVRPLAAPLNSASDDFGVWIDSTAASGYFSSNRGKRSKDDIYYFSESMPDFSEAKTITAKTSFCYAFFEEKTLASNDTAHMTYEWDFGDGARGRGLKTRHCYAGPGDYHVKLNIVDRVSGEVFISQTSYQLAIDWPDQLVIACPENIQAGQEISLSSTHCYLKGYELSKTYWSFGDGRFTSGKIVKHSYAKPGIYTIEAGLMAKNLASGKTEQFKTEKKIEVK